MNKNESTSTASELSSSATTNQSSTSSPSVATASNSGTTEMMKENSAFSQQIPRILQNFLLVWLDTNFDESKEDFQRSIQLIRNIVASITTFKDVEQCVDFISDIEDEKVFLIVTDSIGRHLISDVEIHTWTQLNSIYVLDDRSSTYEQYAHVTSKVSGVYTQIEPICETLKVHLGHCDRAMISMSFNGIDPLFMYTQLFKEALLEIEDDDDKSIRELIEYCRLQGNIHKDDIDKFEREYHQHRPIWWYTTPYFIYSMLNRALRLMDVDIILKMSFFIRHLHKDIEALYCEQQSTKTYVTPFRVFRGQGLSSDDFEKMKKTKGGLMSFNNFLSTSLERQVSFVFADSIAISKDSKSLGVLFVMTIDPKICETSSVPFVDVKNVGSFGDNEQEILFSTHSIFRIDGIEHIPDDNTDRLWEINLTLVGNDNHDLVKLTSQLRRELTWTKGWSRFGDILIRAGKSSKAEHLYRTLLRESSSEKERAHYNVQLGRVYYYTGEYSKALVSYEQVLEIRKIDLSPNYHELAFYYNNIGLVYCCTGEYSKSLASHERSLEIKKLAASPNDSELAISYHNMAGVYYKMGDYSKALLYYEKDLKISEIALPSNHPSLAVTYNNIGLVYANIGEYSKALESHERSLKIKKIVLPPNHPDLASSYNCIGELYFKMGQCSEALSWYQRSFEIIKIALPPNHPDLAFCYNNIGCVYSDMGEYLKAQSAYERSLEIRKKVLPSNHPSLATSYNNIGLLHMKMGEYSKALLLHQKALGIYEMALPQNHPSLATVYNNIGDVYKKMGKYSNALSWYERSLEVTKIALSPNHPDLAVSYNNIGLLYNNMGEYSKALSLLEQSLEITKIALPSNNPGVACCYNNIGGVFMQMGKYSKALPWFEQALEMKKITLPPNHPSLSTSYLNISVLYDNMGEHSKALLYFEMARNIRRP
ncbi:unnamed protein product [Rotaria socialis]|uniref:Uncharacterized protein n=1 Tax=Rotaria socialis TaxID=392032 RepID=A0A820ZXL0_9BILA|nr:unnamed protein product [Rotaria socialis]CAF4567149.1 unnamed protein product [Rotaria socialis]